LDNLFRVRDRLDKEYTELIRQIQEKDEERSKINKSLRDLSDEIDKHKAILMSLAQDIARLETAYETLLDENPYLEGIDPSTVSILDADDLERAKKEKAEFSLQLEKIGPVNFEAQAEYDQEKSRLDFLSQQRDDVHETVKSLRQSIARLNAEAESMFITTFEAARENFKKIFTELFEGGDADVILVDKNGSQNDVNVLEGDIQIMTRPAGKKRLTITQLSKGEKVLVALSLLFGLYLVRPSPFCLLDEGCRCTA
jgi:chromosome segregation protein